MSEYELLYRSYGMLDAKSIQILLESFNIPSKAYQESAGVTLGLTVGGLGAANIYVKKEDLEAAKKIISLMENGKLEIPEVDIEDSMDEDVEIDEDEFYEEDAEE